MTRRRDCLRESIHGDVIGEDESGSVKLGPAEGGLGAGRRWFGEGRQVASRLREEVEKLPAQLIEEWRAEEPESFEKELTAEMEMAVAFTHCLGSNG